ncbi:ABC transporter permease [bacterium]|nr:ABC transporter permease [bacterium]
MKRIWAVFQARNLEFVRDRSSLGWAFLFPFLVVLGFGYMFNSGEKPMYKVAEVAMEQSLDQELFHKQRFIEFIEYPTVEEALKKLSLQKVDLVVSYSDRPSYWVSETSPKSYIVEQMFLASQRELRPDDSMELYRNTTKGQEVRYVDWLIGGILGMNIMFSALFGVGYVIVRYRKNGVLKRLKATPLRPWEFLTAQVMSRFILNILVSGIVLFGCKFAVGFLMLGSYFDLFVVMGVGTMSLISMGLLVAARIQSEELAGGLLNMLTWPMMFLSGVWFSLEGANKYIIKLANVFPLTHMIDAMRQIMTEGAGLSELLPQLTYMLAAMLVCLVASSLMFKWE